MLVCSSSKEIQRTAGRRAELFHDMGIHHRSFDARVPQVLLDLSDIHAVEEEMRRKAVPEGVYGKRLVDPGLRSRCFDGLLDDRITDVMPSDDSGTGVGRQRVTGKDPEPSELAPRIRVLALQRVRRPHARQPGLTVGLMARFDDAKVRPELLASHVGEQCRSVLASFAAAHDDEALVEVEVFHAQLAACRDPQPTAVYERGHQPGRPVHRAQQRGRLRHAQDDGQMATWPRSDRRGQVIVDLVAEHLPAEQEDRAQGLILRTGRDVLSHGRCVR